MRPKCGWRWLVVDDKGKTVTVWGYLGQAKQSCKSSDKVGWTVRHEGTGQVMLRMV